VLDETCGLPLLKAQYACQDILDGMAASAIGMRAGLSARWAIAAPTGLPGNASCCAALAEVFSSEWQTVCACDEGMVYHTAQQPAKGMRRLARLASATCPAVAAAPKPWAWSACSLGNSTTALPSAGVVGAQGSASVVSTAPGRASWEELVAFYNRTSEVDVQKCWKLKPIGGRKLTCGGGGKLLSRLFHRDPQVG